ncbi:MAG: HD domain-containing phosphohydrolase [Brevinematia bacterium]
MDSLLSVLVGVNTGLAFVLWIIHLLMFFLVFLLRSKADELYSREFVNRVLSNLLVTSILLLFLFSCFFEYSYDTRVFSLLKNLSLSLSMLISPFVVRLNWSRMSKMDKQFLFVYTIVFLMVVIFLMLSWVWNIFSLKILVVLLSTIVVLMESFVTAGGYLKYLNLENKLLGISFILLPSLLPTSILTHFGQSEVLLWMLQGLTFAIILVLFVKTVIDILNTYAEYRAVMEDFSKTLKNEERLFRWFTVMLVSILEARDPYTKGHSERVARYSYNLSKLVYNNTYMPNFVEMGALLHDIGKIGVRDEVLFYPSKLSEEMMEEMRHHSSIGKDLLSSVPIFKDLSDIAYLHHERIDGKGYPLGIRGGEIPLYVRISTLADSFDAMNSTRVYRGTLDLGKIKREILDNAGIQFDRKLSLEFVEKINSIV